MEKFKPNESLKYPEIAKELIEMAKADQEMRNNGNWDNSVDEKNTKRLKEK